MGIRSQNRQNFKRSERFFSNIINLDPDFELAYMGRGVVRWRELDDWLGAILDFSELIKSDTLRDQALLNRGMAFFRAGDYMASVRDLEHLVHISDDKKLIYSAKSQLDSLYYLIDSFDEIPSPPEALKDISIPLLGDGKTKYDR